MIIGMVHLLVLLEWVGPLTVIGCGMSLRRLCSLLFMFSVVLSYVWCGDDVEGSVGCVVGVVAVGS